MGQCSTTPGESGLVRHQQVNPQHPEESPAHVEALEMGGRSQKTDFNYFLEANNSVVNMVKEKFDRFDKLYNDYCELKASNERLIKENESLRQRYVEDIFIWAFRRRSMEVSSIKQNPQYT